VAGSAGIAWRALKIAVIDTGVDYTHANFGGPGTVDAFNTAFREQHRAGRPDAVRPNAPR